MRAVSRFRAAGMRFFFSPGRGPQRARGLLNHCGFFNLLISMKTTMKLKCLLAAVTLASIAACGGGSSDESQAGGSTPTEALTEVKYATGCVPNGVNYPPYSRKAEITIVGSIAQPNATVTAEVETFSDLTCTTRTQRLYAKGVATVSADTKTISNGGVTKVGRKGKFTVQDVSLYGVSLSVSPIGQVLNFVVVEEGDKLFFSRGMRDTDGYPMELSLSSATRQP